MITKLAKSHYLETPWKNGGGTAHQIDIWPPNATLAENNFLYRLSSATVKTNGPFSLFLGMERHLIIWKGQGVILNQQIQLLKNQPYCFSGEEPIQCALMSGEVMDVGLIAKQDAVQSRLAVKTLSQEEQIILCAGVHYLFLAQGNAETESIIVEAGDTLKVESEQESVLRIKTQGPLIFFHFEINIIRG